MIKHLVTWKLDESYSTDEKTELLKEMTAQLNGLKGKVEVLKHLSVHTNSPAANASNFDLLLDTEFLSINDLNAYQVHAEHQKVVQYIRTLKLQRAAIDYEM